MLIKEGLRRLLDTVHSAAIGRLVEIGLKNLVFAHGLLELERQDPLLKLARNRLVAG